MLKMEYEKPILEKVEKMLFPNEIIEASTGVPICKQCSSCHGCR